MFTLRNCYILVTIMGLFNEVAITCYCVGKSLAQVTPICITIVIWANADLVVFGDAQLVQQQPTTKLKPNRCGSFFNTAS
jgi:hypothetical protein